MISCYFLKRLFRNYTDHNYFYMSCLVKWNYRHKHDKGWEDFIRWSETKLKWFSHQSWPIMHNSFEIKKVILIVLLFTYVILHFLWYYAKKAQLIAFSNGKIFQIFPSTTPLQIFKKNIFAKKILSSTADISISYL